MADRTVVRQGPVVSLSLGAVLAFAALGPGPDETKPAPPAPPASKPGAKAEAAVPIEQRPYKIRAWLAVDPRARVDSRGRETLLAGWKVMAKRFVGAPWVLEVADGDGPLATTALDDVTSEMVIPLAKGFDKAWMFRVEPDGAGGLDFVGREFDSATAKIGLVCRRHATVPGDGPRALLQLAMDVFAPSAEIAEAINGRQRIRVQGAMLQSADPTCQVVSLGSVFRPTRIFYKPDGGILRIDVIRKTYLRVEAIEGGVATCSIISALGNPFTNKVLGKAKMVAVGLKPASIPTRLRFLTDKAESLPLAGYDLIATPVPNGTAREAGTTDREGRIVLPPNFSDGLVNLRLVAAGVEPLTAFPVMPGEQVEEMIFYNVDPRSAAVTAESEISALRDEIIDQIGVRQRLEARLKSRADAQNWDEVKFLLDDYHKLGGREGFEARLKKLDEGLDTAQKAAPRKPVRTNSAKKLLDDTSAIIERYLDDESFKAYETAYNEFAARKDASKNSKPMPKAPKAPLGKPKAMADGSVEFSPPGGGFRVVLPSMPSEESPSKAADGAADVRTFRLADPSKGSFSVAFWDYPLAVTAEDSNRVLDAERDRLLAALPPGSKVAKDGPKTVAGTPGREVEFTIPGSKPGTTTSQLSRIFHVNSRVISASFAGPIEWLATKPATDFLDSLKSTTGRAAPEPATAKAATPKAEAAPAPAPAAKPQKAPSPAARPQGGGQPF